MNVVISIRINNFNIAELSDLIEQIKTFAELYNTKDYSVNVNPEFGFGQIPSPIAQSVKLK